MKSRQSLLLVTLTFCMMLVNGYAAFLPAGKMRIINMRGFFYEPHHNTTDTVPKAAAEAAKKLKPKVTPPKIVPPKVEVPKVNNNLFKKIAEAFKFRKHARESEKQRVLDIFETLGINDSIAASSENVQLLIDELSIRENQHFDSLIAIINSIKLANEKIPPPATAPVIEKKAADEKPSPSASKIVTDKDIDNLTNKLLPLIAEKANEDKEDTQKREALKEIRKVKYGSNEVNYIVDTTKGIVKRYRLAIRNRAEVYGMHNYTNNSNYDDYKLSYLNTLIYQSLFINGKTGDVKEFNGWDRAQIINDAQKAGCDVVFTAAISLPSSVMSFLNDQKSQKKFEENAIYLLKLRKARGINIAFNELTAPDRDRFSIFIRSLSEFLKAQDPSYKILITLPAYDARKAYDVAYLAKFADRFIVDFSKLDARSSGPIAPLHGKADYTIQTAVSRYLNAEIAPEKLIVCLPYSGTKWQLDEDGHAKLIQYLTYSEIRNRYPWPVYYDEMSGNAVMDSLSSKNMPIRSIWYDDDISLGDKYDFIIGNGLGGVSINALGYDKGFGELWDMLAYKFAKVDTVYLKDSIIVKRGPLTLLERIQRKMTLYWYILKNPCEVCFEDIKDPESGKVINQYLDDLRIDSLRDDANKTRPPNKKIKSKFEYVNDELTSLLGYLTLFSLLVILVCGCIYVYEIKVKSDEWKWKKHAEIILIVLAVLCIIFSFTYLFTNDSIPLFGAAPASVGTEIPVKVVVDSLPTHKEIIDTATTVTVVSNATCITDPNTTCINMPLPTLMAIITAGMLVGLLLTRYLIMPLLKRNDIP
ncbi:MAG: glycoside hydrolase family 18 protein [Bacteroidota bacterium]